MTDQDFDDIDLANALRRAAGTIPDADAAFGTFQRRVRVARIRRVSVAVSSGAAVVVLGVGAFALAGRDNSPVTPTDRRIPLDSVSDPTVTDPVNGENYTSTTSTQPGPSGNSGNTGSPTGSSGTSSVGGGGSSGGVTSSTPPDDEGEDDGRENEGGGSASTSTTVRSSTSTTVGAVSQRCTSVGGSFTAVRLANTVDLRDIVPASGFSVHETENEGSSAKVVFRSGETEIGLEARWTGSGFTCTLEP